MTVEMLRYVQADAIRKTHDSCYSPERRARYEGLSTGIAVARSALEPIVGQ